MKSAVTVCFVGLLGIIAGEAAEGQSGTVESRLATPRRSLDNFLKWQNPPTVDMTIAAETFAIQAELTQVRRAELARQLKAVLDARGLFVSLESVPDDPDYVDPTMDDARFAVFPARLPEVELVRVSDRWIFSHATLSAIPQLYGATFTGVTQSFIAQLPPIFQNSFAGVALWQIAGVVLLILLGLLVRKTVELILRRLAAVLVIRTPPHWDEKLVARTVRPVGFLVMMIVLMLLYADLQLPVRVNSVVSLVLELMIAGSLIWFSFNAVDVLCDYLRGLTARTDTKLDDQLVPLLRKTLKVFAFIIGVIAVVQNYGYSVTSLLAGLGIGGLAVALAAQDTLANFFGSITIFADKPFQTGDWIVTDGVEGTVEEVGFRSTRVRTFYNSVITVPNSKIAASGVDNMGLRRYRRIKQVLGVTYSTTSEQIEAFVEGIRAIIVANRYMKKDFYEIHFNGFGDFSLNILVYCFLDVSNWSEELREKHNFFLEVLRLAEELGVEFAFPTQTVHVDSFYKDAPRSVGKARSSEEMAAAVEAFGPQGKLSRPGGSKLEIDGREVSYPPVSSPTRGAE